MITLSIKNSTGDTAEVQLWDYRLNENQPLLKWTVLSGDTIKVTFTQQCYGEQTLLASNGGDIRSVERYESVFTNGKSFIGEITGDYSGDDTLHFSLEEGFRSEAAPFRSDC